LLAIIVGSMLYTSCGKESVDREDDYCGTTYSIADYYFKPKKLNIIYKYDAIYGDWFANEKIGTYLDDKVDKKQEYAEHYFFADKSTISKYFDWNENRRKDAFIDESEILSPYKEYAEYFGDTILKTPHPSTEKICVLPITGVDVTCDKDFDSEHPAGTKLNDIMTWGYFPNYYDYLNEKDENGKLLHKGKRHYDFCIDYNYHGQTRPLTDIPNKPIMMADNDFTIDFNHKPDNPGRYEFTVKFTFGPDPLSGDTVDIAPASVSIDF